MLRAERIVHLALKLVGISRSHVWVFSHTKPVLSGVPGSCVAPVGKELIKKSLKSAGSPSTATGPLTKRAEGKIAHQLLPKLLWLAI